MHDWTSLLQAIATVLWPLVWLTFAIVALVVLLKFRDPLLGLLPRLRRGKLLGQEVEFEQAVRQDVIQLTSQTASAALFLPPALPAEPPPAAPASAAPSGTPSASPPAQTASTSSTVHMPPAEEREAVEQLPPVGVQMLTSTSAEPPVQVIRTILAFASESPRLALLRLNIEIEDSAARFLRKLTYVDHHTITAERITPLLSVTHELRAFEGTWESANEAFASLVGMLGDFDDLYRKVLLSGMPDEATDLAVLSVGIRVYEIISYVANYTGSTTLPSREDK